MSVKLSAAALARLPADVATPKYQRSDLRAGIVHIGVGNFHRAHQAVYLDDLFNARRDHDWAIVGAGVRDPDVAIREKLKEQDWLTTVVEQEADTTNIRVISPATPPSVRSWPPRGVVVAGMGGALGAGLGIVLVLAFGLLGALRRQKKASRTDA